MEKKKKVLIVGSSASAYALIKKFKTYDCEVVVAPGNAAIAEVAECIDIREDNTKDILEYVLENAIDLTIVVSELAIKADIATLFQENNQLIFAPTLKSAQFTTSYSLSKKFLYKLRVQTPRFAIFDKPQLAVDYLKNAYMPQVIRTDENLTTLDRLVCTTFSTAKTFVEDLFLKDEKKIVLEDFAYGHEFTFYLITDGYSFLPLMSVANYKFLEDGDGGILTSGIGCYAPDYKVSHDVENSIMKNVAERVVNSLQMKETPYLGIIGIDCVLTDDNKFVTLGFKSFLGDHDAEAVLNLIDTNLLDLFEACANGSFGDDYRNVDTLESSSVSCVLTSRKAGNAIKGIDLVESDVTNFGCKKNKYLEYETIEGKNFVLTKTAKTLSRARKNLYEDLSLVVYEGKKYRNDICQQVEIF